MRALVFPVGIGAGLIASAALFAQTSEVGGERIAHPRDIPPKSYAEPMTREDVPPEWQAFLRLSGFVRAEDDVPGVGLGLAMQYGLTKSEAAALLQAVRNVTAEMTGSGPNAKSICSAAISSSEDYVGWWSRFDEATRAHRSAMIDALIAALDTATWALVIEQEFLRWMGLGDQVIGNQPNRQKQVDAADYSVWMRGMCG